MCFTANNTCLEFVNAYPPLPSKEPAMKRRDAPADSNSDDQPPDAEDSQIQSKRKLLKLPFAIILPSLRAGQAKP